MHVTPYLCFEGHCQEAVEFYQQAVGAQVLIMMKFGEVPDCSGEGCSGGAPMNPEALSEGGQVLMPLAPSFFASSWGVCADKFGVSWMVLAPIPVAAA